MNCCVIRDTLDSFLQWWSYSEGILFHIMLQLYPHSRDPLVDKFYPRLFNPNPRNFLSCLRHANKLIGPRSHAHRQTGLVKMVDSA
jgi:hypothetical protein